MKILNIIYDNDSKFIYDMIDELDGHYHIYKFNFESRDKAKCRKLMEEYGTRNLPLIVIQDENLDFIGGVWSENTTDWKKEINNLKNKI